MKRISDLALTALAPAIWGSSYIVATEGLPAGHPLTIACLRALPAGLLLLLLVRRLPSGPWWGRALVLGAFNFAIFWGLLFLAAFRLPGGLAATLGASQPLLVVLFAWPFLGTAIRPGAVGAALLGMGGVGLLVLGPGLVVDGLGMAAALGGAVSMALGTVLTRKWGADVSPLTLTAWQMVAGGVLLAPAAILLDPPWPAPTVGQALSLGYLGLIGAAVTYGLWFRGLAKLGPVRVSALGFLSPLSAVLLGWGLLGEQPGAVQGLGMVLVVGGVLWSQAAGDRRCLRVRTA
ncbi:MAG: EamA family transporter [Rhodospirillum sp.]|nr:EamA family transporter [Rhodospirillum sp.]MCF8490445.1 EamA family transporter [Rhodospirillum sp.]MCF8500458.1 EamA family transporter [Rhodospirillum sp.]